MSLTAEPMLINKLENMFHNQCAFYFVSIYLVIISTRLIYILIKER